MQVDGKREVILKYNITKNRNIEISYNRYHDPINILYWNDGRETGFKLVWWIEGETGEKLVLDHFPKYLIDNQLFVFYRQVALLTNFNGSFHSLTTPRTLIATFSNLYSLML